MHHFAAGSCWLGTVSLVANPAGICALDFGNSAQELRSAAEAGFGPLESGELATSWLAEAVACLEDHRCPPDLPLNPQGTAFQHEIWAALRAIPSGETRTYQELAAALGRPGSERAVARACATNPIAWLIPCHRVIRQDGELAGYRWGLERKRQLLEAEGSLISAPTLF